METQVLQPSQSSFELAGRLLREGQLVGMPTETVYGLAANAFDPAAVEKIFKAKGRPMDNPLIVHISHISQVEQLVKEFSPKARALAEAFWSGPLTIIMPCSDKVPTQVTAGLPTVAVRFPSHKAAQQIINAAGVPLAAPSANLSGSPSPTTAQAVYSDLKGRVPLIIDGGQCQVGLESTVITVATDVPTLLRPGGITVEQLRSVIGDVHIDKGVTHMLDKNAVVASPGMKYKHYAPKAKVVIVKGDKEKYEKFVNSRKNAYALCFDGDNIAIPKVTYGRENDDLSQARELFDALRHLDELGAKKVYAHIPHKDGVGMAVYNRLIRAAAFCVIDLDKPFTIGLTGPTGAGKGYVGEELKKRGFKIIDCDYYVRKAEEKGSPVLEELAAEFGDDILTDGELNRRLLAQRAFESKEKTDALNRIVHPKVIELCRQQADGLCVLDAPQLFEANAQDDCYKVITVVAPDEMRLERILKRDNLTARQAFIRMNAQFDNDYYIKRSDYVIYNDGRDIINQIDKIMEAIL